MTHDDLLSIKDVARLLGVSVWIAKRNEERLGLATHRIRINRRVIRYPRKAVIGAIATLTQASHTNSA
jgi:hypothetical protein